MRISRKVRKSESREVRKFESSCGGRFAKDNFSYSEDEVVCNATAISWILHAIASNERVDR